MLALALSLGVESDPERRPGAGPPPELIDSAGTEAVARGACLALEPDGADTMIVRLPAGGVLIRASGGPIDRIGLRRFATRGFPIDAGALAAGMTARIAIPPDSGPRRWELGLRSGSALGVCGLR